MTDEKVITTMDRRNFFKTLAIFAGAVACSSKVVAYLEEESAGVATLDQISYVDFANAVSYLQEASVGAPFYVVMHPNLYAGLMKEWDVYLREEFGKVMAMAEDEMVLQEIYPHRAIYTNAKTKKIMEIEIVFSEDVPEDEARIVWTTIAEDATLTIGIEDADEVFDYEVESVFVKSS